MIDGSKITACTFHGILVEDFLRMVDAPLSKGDRVELIPVKDGVKIIHIKREEVRR